MKFLATLFISLTLFTISYSQQSGKIYFEDKLDMHKNLPPEKEEVKNMIPQFSTSKWELVFTENTSVYQPHKETELTGASANTTYMRFGRENRILYKDFPDDAMTDSRDFMQKQFLIKGFITARQWKIGKKQKQILGYNCMEATCKVDTATFVTAWFTPQLPVSNGPVDFHGLPGMILQINMNDGERTITATEIQLKEVNTSVIIKPTKGKEITSQEFEKIRSDKMKEMDLQSGNNRTMIYTRRH